MTTMTCFPLLHLHPCAKAHVRFLEPDGENLGNCTFQTSGWDVLLIKRDLHSNPCGLNCLCIFILHGNCIRISEVDWQCPISSTTKPCTLKTRLLSYPSLLFSTCHHKSYIPFHIVIWLHMKYKCCTCLDFNVDVNFLRVSCKLSTGASLFEQVYLTTAVARTVREHYWHLLFNEYKPAQLSLHTFTKGPSFWSYIDSGFLSLRREVCIWKYICFLLTSFMQLLNNLL